MLTILTQPTPPPPQKKPPKITHIPSPLSKAGDFLVPDAQDSLVTTGHKEAEGQGVVATCLWVPGVPRAALPSSQASDLFPQTALLPGDPVSSGSCVTSSTAHPHLPSPKGHTSLQGDFFPSVLGLKLTNMPGRQAGLA